MGIPSLKSAILYCFSLYFNPSSREISRHHANITNIPDHIHKNAPFIGRQANFDGLVHENTPFYGQSTHFSVPIHENSHFYGQQKAVSKIGI